MHWWSFGIKSETNLKIMCKLVFFVNLAELF